MLIQCTKALLEVLKKAWAEAQKERPRSREKINDRLRHCLFGYYYSPLL